ncbi:hypothetical protein D3C75_1055870 [compost metagenome]
MGVLRQLDHWLNALGIHRVKDDGVDPLTDEVLYLLDLLCDIAFGIFKLAADVTFLLHFVLHGLTQDGQEVVIKIGHRHADLDIFG